MSEKQCLNLSPRPGNSFGLSDPVVAADSQSKDDARCKGSAVWGSTERDDRGLGWISLETSALPHLCMVSYSKQVYSYPGE